MIENIIIRADVTFNNEHDAGVVYKLNRFVLEFASGNIGGDGGDGNGIQLIIPN